MSAASFIRKAAPAAMIFFAYSAESMLQLNVF
jgi:hypothetical protein